VKIQGPQMVGDQKKFGNRCCIAQGRTQGLIFYKNVITLAKEINCFRIHFDC